MLGHVVARLFSERGWSVRTTEQRFDGDPAGRFFAELQAARAEVVVNCIAAPSDADARAVLMINGLLPQMLAALGRGALLVHASSDAVFSGLRGDYSVTEAPDAVDAYGLSKRLGERCVELGPAVLLRVSVIGPDLTRASHLLSWYLAQREAVPGYTDVHWNGITSLQWAELALRAAEGGLAPGIHQPASGEVLSKAAVLSKIRAAYGRGVEIEPVASGAPLNRSLQPSCEVPPLERQLEMLRDWYESP